MFKKDILIKLIKIAGDIVFINFAFVIAFYIRYLGNIPEKNFSVYLGLIPYISIFSLVLFYLYDLYANPLHQNLSNIFYSFIPVSFMIAVFTTVISYFLYAFAFPRSVLLIVIPILIFVMLCWRYLFLYVEKAILKPGKAIIIGEIEGVNKLLDNIKENTIGSYNIVSVLVRGKGAVNHPDYKFSSFSDIRRIIEKKDLDVVFLANGLTEEEKKEIFYMSLDQDWNIILVPDFYEIMLSGAILENIGELPVYELGFLNKHKADLFKRIFDISFSLIILIITLPLMLIVAVIIRLESPGPVFYKQSRVGEQAKLINVYKFRTMINNAESMSGPVLSNENDRRITRVGRFLRRSRIDELPQLINVLKGEMSLIGPRPERPFFVEKLEKNLPEYKYRHKVKTGITGLAQVYGYYSTDPQDKLRMDLLYANKSSVLMDLKIILQTIKVMLMKKKSS
jgi:exopolysaccharide biosynthesis polyprenyl glycosylphosphotransferase